MFERVNSNLIRNFLVLLVVVFTAIHCSIFERFDERGTEVIEEANDLQGPGDLDPSFGSNGIVRYKEFSADSFANAVAIQSDGKIIIAGYYYNDTALNDIIVARFNDDGSHDTAFGTGGQVTASISSDEEDVATDVVIDPAGNIVVTGYDYNGTDYDIFVMRLLSDGSFDTGFGSSSNGKVTLDTGSNDYAHSLALQDDGSVVVAGASDSGGDYDFFIAQFTSAGILDTTNFGSSIGYVPIDVAGSALYTDIAYDVGIDSAGNIVAGGAAGSSTAEDLGLVRTLSDGTLDTTNFNATGIVFTDVSGLGSSDFVHALEIDPSDNIVIAGFTLDVFSTSIIARYTTTGSLDSAFGVGGLATSPLLNDNSLNDVQIASDGKIIVGGFVGEDFLLMRYTSSGILDTSFGDNGVVQLDINGFTDEILGMAIDNQGRLVVAGYAGNESAFFEITLARFYL